jgi:thiol-disulfide isomerase/thioredoxin
MVSLHAFLLAAALTGGNDTVLLHFTADWCGPCRQMEPTIQRLRDAGYPLRKVDVDREPDLTRQFRVGPIPCFVLVRDGREVDRVLGAASYDRLARMFEPPREAGAATERTMSSPAPTIRGQSPDVPPAPLTELPNVSSPARDVSHPSTVTAQPAALRNETPRNETANASAVRQQALSATVRLCVRDPKGQSHGTGTIIDVHGDEALVLTCGHIFRESAGQGEISVELNLPGASHPVAGRLVAYEAADRDVGLVSIRPGVAVRPVRVASPNCHLRKGEPVFSVGCDHAANPTVCESTISAVDRYAGAPNLEIVGHPVEGRSGGGLFMADGRLIGVCNAADLQEDRGIYAALATIHHELKAIHQERIFAGEAAPPAAALAVDRPAAPPVPTIPVRSASAPLEPDTQANATEVICIVRSRGQVEQGQRVLVIDTPSPALLQQLEQAAQAARLQPPAVLSAARQPPATTPAPVLRAQNY